MCIYITFWQERITSACFRHLASASPAEVPTGNRLQFSLERGGDVHEVLNLRYMKKEIWRHTQQEIPKPDSVPPVPSEILRGMTLDIMQYDVPMTDPGDGSLYSSITKGQRPSYSDDIAVSRLRTWANLGEVWLMNFFARGNVFGDGVHVTHSPFDDVINASDICVYIPQVGPVSIDVTCAGGRSCDTWEKKSAVVLWEAHNEMGRVRYASDENGNKGRVNYTFVPHFVVHMPLQVLQASVAHRSDGNVTRAINAMMQEYIIRQLFVQLDAYIQIRANKNDEASGGRLKKLQDFLEQLHAPLTIDGVLKEFDVYTLTVADGLYKALQTCDDACKDADSNQELHAEYIAQGMSRVLHIMRRHWRSGVHTCPRPVCSAKHAFRDMAMKRAIEEYKDGGGTIEVRGRGGTTRTVAVEVRTKRKIRKRLK